MSIFSSSLNTTLNPIADHSDPETRKALQDILNALATLTLDSSARSRAVCRFDEAVAAGGLVNITASGHARNANATGNTRPCFGYVGGNSVAINTDSEVLLQGILNLAGLTPGAVYYLGLVNGTITATKPVTAGNIVQPVGFALTATQLFFSPSLLWTQL